MTEFGKIVYDNFKSSVGILNEINTKVEKLKVHNQRPSGTLKIQLPLSMSHHVITPNLMLFKRKYPQILSNKGRLYCTTQYAEKYGVPQTLDELQNHLFVGVIYNNFIMPEVVDAINDTTGEVIPILNGQKIATNHDLQNVDLLLSNEVIVGLLDSTYKKIKNDNIIPVLSDYHMHAFEFYLLKNPYNNQVNIKLFADFIDECLK